jgi:hypothetical protein
MGHNETPTKGNIMTFKSVMSTIGHGLLTTAELAHNTPIQMRINEIDSEIEKLEQERRDLQDKLIED